MHLFLHIGPPKTGSTAIQKGLELNDTALKEAGVLPMFYRATKEHPLPLHALGLRHKNNWAANQGPLHQRFKTQQAAREWSDGYWKILAEAVQTSDADLCVISSEHLGYGIGVPGFLADLNKIFSGITVLAYARDPASLYFSSMQQNLRGGKRLAQLRTPATFAYRHRKEVGKYINVLGAENVTMRNFSRDNLVGGDVVVDFFAQLERFGKTIPVEPVQANESIPGAALALIMLINEATGAGGITRQRQQLINRIQSSEKVAQLPTFSPKMAWARALIRANAADGVQIRGENSNALFFTYQTCRAITATRQRGKPITAEADNPWYGAEQVKPRRAAKRYINTFVDEVLAPDEGTTVTGFKEVRHTPFFMKGEQFQEYMDFLLDNFPNARILCNSRDGEKVSQSGFLKTRDSELVRRDVSRTDGWFKALCARSNRCLHMQYDEYVADPSLLRDMFAFLELPYDPDRLQAVLDKPLTHAKGKKQG